MRSAAPDLTHPPCPVCPHSHPRNDSGAGLTPEGSTDGEGTSQGCPGLQNSRPHPTSQQVPPPHASPGSQNWLTSPAAVATMELCTPPDAVSHAASLLFIFLPFFPLHRLTLNPQVGHINNTVWGEIFKERYFSYSLLVNCDVPI